MATTFQKSKILINLFRFRFIIYFAIFIIFAILGYNAQKANAYHEGFQPVPLCSWGSSSIQDDFITTIDSLGGSYSDLVDDYEAGNSYAITVDYSYDGGSSTALTIGVHKTNNTSQFTTSSYFGSSPNRYFNVQGVGTSTDWHRAYLLIPNATYQNPTTKTSQGYNNNQVTIGIGSSGNTQDCMYSSNDSEITGGAGTITTGIANYRDNVDQCRNLSGDQFTVPTGYYTVDTDYCIETASQYDESYQRTLELHAYGFATQYDSSCDEFTQFDVSDWASRLTDDVGGSANSSFNTFKQYYNEVVLGGVLGGWKISTGKHTYHDKQQVTITIWKGTANLVWDSPSTSPILGGVRLSGTGLDHASAVLNPICSGGNWILQEQSPNPNAYAGRLEISRPAYNIGGHTSEILSILVNGSYNANYPSGYGGIEIVTGLQIENQTYADFDLQLEAFDITATYRGSQYDDPKCTELIWRLVNADDPYSVVQHSTIVTEALTTTLPEPGTYRLDLTWSWRVSQMELGGLNPANEEYCQDKNDEIVELFNQGLLPRDTGKVFPVDGLSSEFFGYDGERECYYDDEPGNGFGNSTICVYTGELTLEDCSVYGIDELHTRLGCEFTNFFKRIKNWFNGLWVVRPYFIQSRVTDFNNHIQENMSIVTYPVAFASDMVSITANSGSTCPEPDLAFMGESASIDLCQMETTSPATWDFIKVGVTAVFAFMFVAVLHGAYHRLWSSSDV